MKRLLVRAWPVCAILALSLAGCRGQGGSTRGAAQAIEAYLQARVQSNVDQMTLLSCPDWEAQARLEATSFQSMSARLEGVSCQAGSGDGATSLVTCQGKIVTTYQGETREWSVADHPYKAVKQDGEWRMCGYGD